VKLYGMRSMQVVHCFCLCVNFKPCRSDFVMSISGVLVTRMWQVVGIEVEKGHVHALYVRCRCLRINLFLNARCEL
jgi:hypothetical protein